MQEIVGDLWSWYGDAIIAITTGGQVSSKGNCSMPRGCASQARQRFPELPAQLGELIRRHGNQVFDLGNGIVTFPVENTPFEVPDLRMIERSCLQLKVLTDRNNWPLVILPRPGCGGGGLSWKEVRPLLERHLDDRFRVITLPG
ncbi:MAG: hypothetical protein AB7D06_07765 [Pedobacter sp.]